MTKCDCFIPDIFCMMSTWEKGSTCAEMSTCALQIWFATWIRMHPGSWCCHHGVICTTGSRGIWIRSASRGRSSLTYPASADLSQSSSLRSSWNVCQVAQLYSCFLGLGCCFVVYLASIATRMMTWRTQILMVSQTSMTAMSIVLCCCF